MKISSTLALVIPLLICSCGTKAVAVNLPKQMSTCVAEKDLISQNKELDDAISQKTGLSLDQINEEIRLKQTNLAEQFLSCMAIVPSVNCVEATDNVWDGIVQCHPDGKPEATLNLYDIIKNGS